MKILFYISTIKGGGAARVMCNIANELSQDNEIIFVTNFPSEHEYKLTYGINRVNLAKKELKSNAVKRNIFLIKALREILKRETPDVAISFMGENNVRLLFADAGLMTKTIISVRNDPRREYPSRKYPKITDFLYQRADGLVFQTEDAKAFFSNKVQSKAQIILNQVDAGFFQKYDKPGKYIVACGRLSKQKNYPMMLLAFSEVHKVYPEEILLIYGEGELKDDLVSLARTLNIDEVVKFMGFSSDMKNVYKEAKLLVMTSDYEGLPNAMLEALASSVPVISTDCPCGGPKMMIKDGINGYLIPVGNTDLLTTRIKEMVANDSYLKLKNNAFLSAQVVNPDKVYSMWKEFIYSMVPEK